MGKGSSLLEGVGSGRMSRIIMGKYRGPAHLASGVITSVKVAVVIGVIEESNIEAGLNPRTNQTDVTFSS